MRNAAENDTQVHLSSGNVFADLGIPDAEEYMAKSKMAVQIFQIIKNRRLTQAAAGKLLGITQPKVSALLNGRLDGFSTERLFRFLNTLGCDVQITVSRPRSRGRGRVEVLNPPFQALPERSRRSVKKGKGLSEQEFWTAVQARAQSRRKAPTQSRRSKP
jgi:predicted XRE-type DNA-binding protein